MGWFVLLAPAGTPDAIVRKVNRDLAKVLDQPDFQRRFQDLGTFVRPLSPMETTEFIRSEQRLWRLAGAPARHLHRQSRSRASAYSS